MTRSTKRMIGWSIAILVVAITAFSAAPEPQREYASSGDGTSAHAVLSELPVKGRAPKTGYDRSQFGDGWGDLNGCDVRNVILYRDLRETVLSEECIVVSGVLDDPYTGTTISFSRSNPSAVQIDHVVALSDAWQKGAQQLSPESREQFANDPLNLLAVDGPANQQKGDGDAATWLPSASSFRCSYVARQIAVKQKYELWVTAAEKTAMERVLDRCPLQTIPTP